MFDLLIAKEANTYAAKTGGGLVTYHTLNELETGALAIFTEDGTLITAATTPAALVKVKQFYMAVGRQDDVKVTVMIDRSGFHRTYCGYTAPVAYEYVVGNDGGTGSLNLPGTLIEGTVAQISVGYDKEGTQPFRPRYRSEYVVKAGDTNAIIVTALIADINSKTHGRWTAVVVGAQVGIKITSTVDNATFYVTTDGILSSATLQEETALVVSKGAPADVLVAEHTASLEEGNKSPIYFETKFYGVKSEVDSAAEYDTYSIQWGYESRTPVNVNNATLQEVNIAIPVGTQSATLDTILGNLLLLPTASSGSSSSTL